MMNCYQYKIVCQVKNEVLKIIKSIQLLTVDNIQKGLPAPEISKQYLQKLHCLQEVLNSNHILTENFNLSDFATECLQAADSQLLGYINSYVNQGCFHVYN